MTEERGGISLFSKLIIQSEGVVERDIGRSCVLEALNFTRFCKPQLEILSRSVLIAEDKATRDWVRAKEEGCAPHHRCVYGRICRKK